MLTRLLQLIGPPAFADEERDRIARTLFVIQLTLLAAALAVLVIALIVGETITVMSMLLGGVVTIVALWLNHRGHTRSASFGVILILLSLTAFFLLTGQGMHDIAITLYPVIIIAASLLLARRAFSIVVAVMVITLGLIAYIEINHSLFIVYPPQTIWYEFAILAVILIIAAGAAWFLSGNLIQNLQRARLTKQALSEANAQLQQEIVERIQAEEALLQSKAISAAVAHIARQLLEASAWREQIQAVLAQLGRVSNATHVYVFENHLSANGELRTSQRYEWVMSGFQPEIDDPRLQNMPVHQAELDDWYEPLARGEPYYSTSRDFSEHWSESLNQRGIKTLLDVPIFVNGEWWGIIGFDDCVNELAWSQVEINALRTAADILGAAIQRQRADEEREKLIADLEAKNTELERFTYTVSHDLKAPLITIRGFLGLVEQDALAGNREQLAQDMLRIVEATDKMRQLLDDLLELSRIGRTMNSPEDTPFEVLVREALELTQGRIEAGGVQVEVAADLPVVYGDRVRLVEVVQNLVDNAAKFMGDQPEPRITIGWNGIDRDGKPVLFVRDNGIGIDPKYHDKVFGLFNKLDPQAEGTGVGLALVKRIVEVHGGTTWVESDGMERGATFFFTLPGSPQ